ncbi:hypothetical protein EP7_004423 [Isosphaeraceae bacterium EP7]
MFFRFVQITDRDMQPPMTADGPSDVVASPPAVESWSDLGRMGLAGCEPAEDEAELRRLGLLAGRDGDEAPRWM